MNKSRHETTEMNISSGGEHGAEQSGTIQEVSTSEAISVELDPQGKQQLANYDCSRLEPTLVKAVRALRREIEQTRYCCCKHGSSVNRGSSEPITLEQLDSRRNAFWTRLIQLEPRFQRLLDTIVNCDDFEDNDWWLIDLFERLTAWRVDQDRIDRVEPLQTTDDFGLAIESVYYSVPKDPKRSGALAITGRQ